MLLEMYDQVQGIIDGITKDSRFKASVVRRDGNSYAINTDFRIGNRNLVFMMAYYNYNGKWKLSHALNAGTAPVVKKILADYKVLNSSGSVTVDVDPINPGDGVFRLACAVIELVGLGSSN